MRHFFLYLFCAGCWLGCTNPKEPAILHISQLTEEEIDPNRPPEYKLEIRKSFTDVPTNIREFCTSGYTRNCGRELHERLLELTAINPVPVPQPNTEPPIPAAEADQLYRQFVATHSKEPILILFRQHFPRILLNKYGILTGNNYPLTAYYTRQLIESGSYDFVTQVNALKAIQTHVPAAQFNRLAQLATANAQQYEPQRQAFFKRQITGLSADKIDDRLMPKAIRKQVIAKISNEKAADDQAVAQLEKLSSESTDQSW